MLRIGKNYTRTSPSGEQSLIEITTQEGLEYHRQLAESGFVYEEVADDSPRVCIACES